MPVRSRSPLEDRVVPLLQALFPARGELVPNGDDAAVLHTSARTAITVDTQTENVHFRWEWASPEELGARLIGVVLSDLAAVGGRAQFGVLSLTVPRGFSYSRLKAYLKGMALRAARENFTIAGGDVTNGFAFAAVLTALGDAPERPLTRSAEEGDVLCVSGPIGRAGLELQQVLGGERVRLRRWLEPPSRLKLGQMLARDPLVHGAMDISDGLFLDARRMAEASGLGLAIDFEAIPLDAWVRRRIGGLSQGDKLSAIGGGEDYELLVAVDPAKVPKMLTPIGRFRGKGFAVTVAEKRHAWPRAGHLHA